MNETPIIMISREIVKCGGCSNDHEALTLNYHNELTVGTLSLAIELLSTSLQTAVEHLLEVGTPEEAYENTPLINIQYSMTQQQEG